MNVTIFGATGTTGRFVVEEALRRGHKVVALSRNPAKLDIEHENLETVTGDVLDPEVVDKAIAGQDAVISVLGAGMRRTTLRTDGTRNIVEAMRRRGVGRLISQSVFGLGDSAEKLPIHWKLLVKPLILRNAYRDHAGQEAVVASSDLDWTITRPVSLRDTAATGDYQDGPAAAMNGITLKIGLADLARFTLDQLETDKYRHRRPGVSY
jgi:putative NADH-flavin reductase